MKYSLYWSLLDDSRQNILTMTVTDEYLNIIKVEHACFDSNVSNLDELVFDSITALRHTFPFHISTIQELKP